MFRKSLLAMLFCVLAAMAAMAQTYKDSSGNVVVPAFVPLGGCPVGGGTCAGPAGSSGSPTYVTVTPYAFTPLASSPQYAQPATTSTALTVPSTATYATVCAETGQMNYTTSGTAPTTGAVPTAGIPLAAGACVPISGHAVLTAFRIINAVASTGTWAAEFFQ